MPSKVAAPRTRSGRGTALLAVLLGFAALQPLAARAQAPATPEEIQRQREASERRKLDYLDQKRKVDHINKRVREYKQLMGAVPFEPLPNTTNLVEVYVNGHDIHDVAHKLYFLSDGSDEVGFARYFWPKVLELNRAGEYDDGLPLYGRLDPQAPENNVALFPNVRRQEFIAVVSQVSSEDSALAMALTAPVVQAYHKRRQEELDRLAASAGEVTQGETPVTLSTEPIVALFRGEPTEPKETYPRRRTAAPTPGSIAPAEVTMVTVDQEVPLEPAPPAWSLRQGINMLGPKYEGYNMKYVPDRFDVMPEVAPIALLGGRDPEGLPHTQLGLTFGLNERFFSFLLTNESAFVAWSRGGAPSVTGGSLSAGLDLQVGPFNLAGMAGLTAIQVVGEHATGPSVSGRVRFPVSDHLFMGFLYRYTGIDHFRVEERDSQNHLVGGRTGVYNVSYVGLSFALR
jgi:hypothetical protein